MKIAIIGPAFPYRGGIAHYTALLSRELAQRGHPVRVLNFTRLYPNFLFPGKSQFEEDETFDVVADNRRILDSVNPLTWLTAAGELRAWAPDLLICQWWHPFFAPCLRAVLRQAQLREQTVMLCHNVFPHERRVWDRPLLSLGLSAADRFLVHAKSDAVVLRQLRPQAEIQVGAHPRYSVFQPKKENKMAARKTLKLPEFGPVLLFFGLIRPYKGLDVLLQALPKIQRTLPDVHLHIAGECYGDPGIYTRMIQNLKLEDRVSWENQYIPNRDVALRFAAADLVVLPYRHASQSGIAQIAFACERPVIASQVGGLAESIVPGETGLLVPPESPDALTEGVTTFFQSNQGPGMLEGIREQAAAFSWSRLAEQLIQLVSDPASSGESKKNGADHANTKGHA